MRSTTRCVWNRDGSCCCPPPRTFGHRGKIVSKGTYTNQLKVTIDGRPLTNELNKKLVEGWVDTSVNVPASFQLTFRDPGRSALAAMAVKLGSKVVLRAQALGRDGGKPLLTGEVTALEADFDGTGKFSVVRGYDPGHRLLRNRRVEAWPKMT